MAVAQEHHEHAGKPAGKHAHEHPVDPPDVVGQVLSVLCAVHCAATPFVVMAVPAAASFLGGFHPVLLVFVIGVGLWAFVPGYRQHQRKEVVALAVGGVTLLAVAALVFHSNFIVDTALSFCGALLMLTAHWRNRVLQRRCCAH